MLESLSTQPFNESASAWFELKEKSQNQISKLHRAEQTKKYQEILFGI